MEFGLFDVSAVCLRLGLVGSPPAGLDAQSRVAPGVPHEEFAALD